MGTDSLQLIKTEFCYLTMNMDLQLPCSVTRFYRHITVNTRFLSEVFGIAPTDNDGVTRSLGTYLPVKHPAVFWQMSVTCVKADVVSVHSNYHVTLIDIQEWRVDKTYTFVIHPVPIDELRECRIAIMPQWIVTIDGHDVALQAGSAGTWLGDNITVLLDGWIPCYSFIDRC